MHTHNPMQAQSLAKIQQPVEKLCKSVENSKTCGKLSPLTIRDAGGLMFFYPGPPMWRKSGTKVGSHSKEYRTAKFNLGWAARFAARANGAEWEARHMPMRGPIVLGIVVFRAVPITNKPDLDNYLKMVADALTGVVYADDAQVCEYFPGSRKETSLTQGIRIVVLPQEGMMCLGLEDRREF